MSHLPSLSAFDLHQSVHLTGAELALAVLAACLLLIAARSAWRALASIQIVIQSLVFAMVAVAASCAGLALFAAITMSDYMTGPGR